MKTNQSLKALRKITVQNQSQFAAMIGVSVDLIKSVECGRQPVSRKLNTRIGEATAATILDLWGRPGKPVPNGVVYARCPQAEVTYTKERWESWKKRKTFTPDTAEQEFESLEPAIRALFRQAAHAGKTGRNRVPALSASLFDWFMEACANFKLNPLWQESR